MQPQSFAHHPRSTGVGQLFLLGDPCARQPPLLPRHHPHNPHKARLPTTKKRAYLRNIGEIGLPTAGCYSSSAFQLAPLTQALSLSLSFASASAIRFPPPHPPAHPREAREKLSRMPLTHAHPGSGSPSSPLPPPPSFPAADHTAAIAAAAAATTTTTTSPPSPPVPPPSSSPPPAPSSPSPSPLESLPTELLTRIATTLPTLRDLKSLRLTSRRLADGTSYAYGVRGLSRVQFFFFRRSLRRLAELSRSEKWSKHVREVRIAKSFVPWRKKHQAPQGREWERQREVQVHMMVHRGGLGAGGEEGREDAVVGVGEDGFGVLGGVRCVMVEIRTGRAGGFFSFLCLFFFFWFVGAGQRGEEERGRERKRETERRERKKKRKKIPSNPNLPHFRPVHLSIRRENT